MIAIWILFALLFFHWVFDFVLQTDEMAKNKSTDLSQLLSHTLVYSGGWMVMYMLYLSITDSTHTDAWVIIETFKFTLITFICHTVTDFFTSKLNKYLWDKKDVHNFFVSIGFDQFLHYVQLVLTFYFLNSERLNL